MSQPVEKPQYTAYSEAVKELQIDGMYELQRLATKMPDQLLVSLTNPPPPTRNQLPNTNRYAGCVRPVGKQSG